MLFLYLPPSSCLASNTSSTNLSSLIALCCSCACKEFNNYAKVMFDRSLVFSNMVMVVLNPSSIVTKTFSTMRESLNTLPSNLILFAMPKSLLEYSLNLFTFCNVLFESLLNC